MADIQLPVSYRNKNHVLDRPAASSAFLKRAPVYRQLFRPGRKTLRFPTKLYDTVIACIASLFFGSRPPAILREIPKTVIDSLDAASFWPVAHVLDKRVETRTPSIAYEDAFTAIPTIRMIVGVLAPVYHVMIASVSAVAFRGIITLHQFLTFLVPSARVLPTPLAQLFMNSLYRTRVSVSSGVI